MRSGTAISGLTPQAAAGKAQEHSGTNSHCILQCCNLARDCNWEQSSRWLCVLLLCSLLPDQVLPTLCSGHSPFPKAGVSEG